MKQLSEKEELEKLIRARKAELVGVEWRKRDLEKQIEEMESRLDVVESVKG